MVEIRDVLIPEFLNSDSELDSKIIMYSILNSIDNSYSYKQNLILISFEKLGLENFKK